MPTPQKLYLGDNLITPPWPNYGILDRLADSPNIPGGSFGFYASINTGAVAHVKTPWAEIDASTAKTVDFIDVYLLNSALSATNSSALLDIAVGAVGSEVVIVSNLPVGYGNQWSNRIRVPVRVAAGVRLSVRVQGVRVSALHAQAFDLRRLPDGAGRGPDHLVTMGTNLATSQGVVVPAATVANVRTPWVEVVASSIERFSAVILGVQFAGDTITSGNLVVDVGIGPAGAEVVVVPDVPYSANTAEFIQGWTDSLFAADIPAGSRIAVRMQNAQLANPIDITVIGVPAMV